MKVVFSFPVELLTGKTGVAGIVFFPWRTGLNCARRMVVPTNPATAQQSAIRNILTQCSQAYQLLSESEISAWRVYAANHPVTKLGSSVTLPANNMYARVNSLRLIDGQSVEDAAPSQEADFVASDIASVAYNSGTTHLTFDVTHNASTLTDRKWLIRVTASLNSPVVTVRSNDYRLVKGVSADSIISIDTSPQTIDITAPIISNWANGDTMGIELVPMSPQYSPGTPYAEKNAITVT